MSASPSAAPPRSFLDLHRQGFIMPNAWDAGSATILAAAGFPAIATTSAGIAFSLGRQDYQVADPRLGVAREEMFERMGQIVRAVDLPVNGDLEAGYGDEPEAVAQSIRLAMEADLAGGNIEDKKPLEDALYDEGLAVERIAAARAEIDGRGGDFVLTARTDAFRPGADPSLAACIRRANLYRQAGADCLFTPGVADLETVATLVREIDGPLNIVMGLVSARGNAHALLAAGVRRISLGGAIARSALGFVRRCAEELRDQGGVSFAEGQLSGGELNALFARGGVVQASG